MPKGFRAIVVSKKDEEFDIDIENRTIDQLPDGDLLIRVEFSSLNYKDALSATGAKGVTKVYPHTPGIDAAGIVEQSNDENFPIGSSVIVTGFDLGMDTSGGFSEYIRVPSQWAVKCSSNFSTKEAMMLGTAGMTAGLAILSIADKLPLDKSKAVVSGATGGVGSIGVRLLSQLGADVTAITGKMNKNSSFPQNDHRNYNINGDAFDVGETFSGVNYTKGLEAVEKLKELIPSDFTLTDLALKWILMHPEVSVVIPGAKNKLQASNNVIASDLNDIDSLMSKINSIYNEMIKEDIHHRW